MALPASAHTDAELDAWRVEWVARADVTLSAALFAEWDDMAERHPFYFNPTDEDARGGSVATSRAPSATRSPGGSGIERWRPIVAKYFGAGFVDRALCLIGYESRGDPNAYNSGSGASGLFQHLARYWAERSSKAGWAGASIFDPEANVAVAAWLARQSWRHWSPYNRGLCR